MAVPEKLQHFIKDLEIITIVSDKVSESKYLTYLISIHRNKIKGYDYACLRQIEYDMAIDKINEKIVMDMDLTNLHKLKTLWKKFVEEDILANISLF